MAIERSWERQGPVTLTASGGQDGLITVDNVACFKVKQQIVLSSNTQPDISLQIKEIVSLTQIYVGPDLSKSINQTKKPQNQNNMKVRSDISAYLIADGASIRAPRQSKSTPKVEDILKAVYEQEPAVALRTMGVDKIGNAWSTDNPMPIEGNISVSASKINTNGRITKIEVNPNTWTLLERSATTSPIGLGPLSGRCVMLIQNFTGEDIIIQYDNGTTDDTISIRLPDCAERVYEYGPDIQFYVKSATSTVDIVFEEAT